MKLDVCCVCGKELKKNQTGVGPECIGKVGNGPNPQKAKFSRTQFFTNVIKARELGLLLSYDFTSKHFFCVPSNYPVLPNLDQDLMIKKLKRYFYRTLYHSISGPEQHELVKHLYED